MKFTPQFALAVLATGAAAHAIDTPSKVERALPNVVGRQIATVTGVLNQVGSSIDSLDSAVKAFSGNGQPLTSAANSLVSTLKQGESTVSGSQDLSLTDALGLQSPVTALTTKGQTLTNDLKAKRSAIEAAGLCETTRTQLTDINSASQALIKATVAKVPTEAQSIAQNLASGLTNVLNQAQDDFSTTNCVDKSGSGGSSSTSAGTSSSPASSTAASSSAPVSSSVGSSATSAASSAASSPASSPSSTASTAPTSTGAGSPPATNGTSTTGATAPSTVPTGGAAYLAPAGIFAAAIAVALL